MIHTNTNKELLNNVASEVVICIKCDLSKTRRKAAPGTGNTETKILLIGEAPGESEDIKGEPFVGSAGKFLDELLNQISLSRNDVFITNIVKCRPPNNRDPLPTEIETCTPYLNRQIGTLEPKFIITLGRHSTAYIFSKTNLPFTSITQTRGKTYDTSLLGLKITIFPTFHPAAALYHARYKDQLQKDFDQIKIELQKRGLINP
jgi:uracil-DNA glycosylase family 4